ncbi:helix-turn-helix domain-containing protein [Roseburia sp. 1XD42-69]|uniref:helix-turn-helix domain-containing protein n=1 Tax=Roseburia sp. 1XD42-69 TaxID=2320088 RepID=UPI0018F76D40
MTFGEKLYKLRKSQGLSQEALAEKLYTSRQAVSKWLPVLLQKKIFAVGNGVWNCVRM